ncbi:MAG TPA: alpha-ketoglutarate-dependent dioxygenase AlkB, partial [Acidimicrobiales bacterium]|nr:alpha-ketoglutarate-dependent dioxygenase AlkB [Acidimicrobiales bacterium]
MAPGAVHLPRWLGPGAQRRLLADCLGWADSAGGFRRPQMPNGTSMSVGIACLGWHWFPYRYSRTVDDGDGRPVPPFPPALGDLARRAAADAAGLDPEVAGDLDGGLDTYRPDVALLNRYERGASMGLHADRDEPHPAPVVSLSLGRSAVFRFGNTERRGPPYVDVVLESGDAFVFGGPSRRCYHGVPKVFTTSTDPGRDPDGLGLDAVRLNVTVRQSGLDGSPFLPSGRRRPG